MRTRTTAGRTSAARLAAGACMECGFVNANTERATMKCHGCGTRVKLTFVTGSYNQAQPCDDRCQYAVGPICSCSCGGTNHRVGYIHVERVPVWVRQRDKQRHQDRKARAEQRDKQKRQTREELAQARRKWLLERHPGLVELLDERFTRHDADPFLYEMHYAYQRGDMTDGQAAAAVRALEGRRRYEAKVAEREQREQELRSAGIRVPTGRVTFKGRIVSVKDEENRFTWRANTVWKVLVETDEGWKVWGTLPHGLEPPEPTGTAAERDRILALWRGWHKRLPGREVTIQARVKASDDDPLFGYFANPRLVAAGPDPAVAAHAAEPEPTPPPAPAPARPAAPANPDPWGKALAALGL